VWLFYLEQIRKTDVKLMKNLGHVFFSVTFSVGLPAKVNNPVPTSQAPFQQFRVIELFCVKVAASAMIVVHSSNVLEIFTERTYRASISSVSALRKLTFFHFFLVTVGEGASQMGASHQLNPA